MLILTKLNWDKWKINWWEKRRKKLNCENIKKSNCVQLKNIFLQNYKTQIMTKQKISRILEPQHLAVGGGG